VDFESANCNPAALGAFPTNPNDFRSVLVHALKGRVILAHLKHVDKRQLVFVDGPADHVKDPFAILRCSPPPTTCAIPDSLVVQEFLPRYAVDVCNSPIPFRNDWIKTWFRLVGRGWPLVVWLGIRVPTGEKPCNEPHQTPHKKHEKRKKVSPANLTQGLEGGEKLADGQEIPRPLWVIFKLRIDFSHEVVLA